MSYSTGVLFRIDVYHPQGHPSAPSPARLAYFWVSGGAGFPDFDQARTTQPSVLGYPLDGGPPVHVATNRIVDWYERPDAAETVEAIRAGYEKRYG